MDIKKGQNMSGRDFSSLELLAKFANSHSDYITDVNRLPLYNDEPKLFTYAAHYKTKKKTFQNDASGVSFNKKRALRRVLGETLERYCLDNYEESSLTIGSLDQLNKPFLHPSRVISFSKNQLQKKLFRDFIFKETSKFRWIEGISLFKNKKILIPAQLLFTSYQPLKDEPWIRFPISTGAAAGISLGKAIYTGICEIIERDAFLISYLNRLNSPTLDLNLLEDKDIKQILDSYSRYRLELVILDITADLGVPTFAAITLDRTGLGPAVSVGLKAGFNIKETIIGAIEESLMVRSWLRDKFVYGDTAYEQPKIIRSIEDRAYFWFKPDTIKYLDFWLNNNKKKKVNLGATFSDNTLFEKVISLLRAANLEVFYVDITDSIMEKFGFTVVKVIIPQLQPLYLDEEYPYFGGNRLYEVPVRLGYLKKPIIEDGLNKIPHPFL